jgi:hypothetical protein
VSHVDGPSREPDPLKPPEEGLLEGMGFGEPQPVEPLPGEPPLEAPGAAGEQAEPAAGKKKREKKRKKDRKEKIATEEVPGGKSGPSLFARIRQASPYTVTLAVAAGALFIGIVFLVLYLGRYGFQISPPRP